MTTAQDGRYQQLRAHLATLKLLDAAEALPAVLDPATRRETHPTAALERLLRTRGHRDRRPTARRPAPLRLPAHPRHPGRVRLRRPTRRRPQPDRRPRVLPLPRVRHQRPDDRPARGRQDPCSPLGLARKAVEAGYRTYFTTAADLAARCHRAAIEGRWATTMRFYAGPTLLAIDELGYLPLPAEAASALFQVVAQRYLKTSIILTTTNRGVTSWGEVLGDTTVAAALLDRLLHRSVVLDPRRRLVPAPRPPRPHRQAPPRPPAPAPRYADCQQPGQFVGVEQRRVCHQRREMTGHGRRHHELGSRARYRCAPGTLAVCRAAST